MEYVKRVNGEFKRFNVPDSYIYDKTDNFGMSTKEAIEQYIAELVSQSYNNKEGASMSEHDVTYFQRELTEELRSHLEQYCQGRMKSVVVKNTSFAFTFDDERYEVRVTHKRN